MKRIVCFLANNEAVLYLAMTKGRWLSRHCGHIEQNKRTRFVIQIRICSDGAGDWINGEVSIRITRVDGIARSFRA